MRVLIVGAGIAGPSLAFWLLRQGMQVTLVEKAPRLRTGGYIIDFWGAGYDIAERMGLLPELQGIGYRVTDVRMVGRDGRRVSGFPADALGRMTGGRYMSLARGDLAACIYRQVAADVETLFGDSVTKIEDKGSTVHVTFEQSAARDFDLVIGADGLHSSVRRLVFGEQSRFEKYLGYKVAAFEVSGYRPRDEDVYVLHTQVGQQVGRFSMRDDRTMFLFVFRDAESDAHPGDMAAQKALIRRRYAHSAWECPQILAALDQTQSLYFDRVSQVHMPRWSQGRVALLGDAAACASLLAGQGSALAMVEAYILAGELKTAGGDPARAFAAYERRLMPFLAMKQKAAARFAGSFAPSSALGLFLRNQIMKAFTIPWIAELALGSDLRDKFDLPAYDAKS